MPRYAQIDVITGCCHTVSNLLNEVSTDNVILLEDDADVQPGDIYMDGEWTRLEPEPTLESDITVAECITTLEVENHLLKAQNQAMADRFEFIEDMIAEMAMQIYQ